LSDMLQRADQKDQDMMNVMRFEALKRWFWHSTYWWHAYCFPLK
jgi:hypothetical protein